MYPNSAFSPPERAPGPFEIDSSFPRSSELVLQVSGIEFDPLDPLAQLPHAIESLRPPLPVGGSFESPIALRRAGAPPQSLSRTLSTGWHADR